MDRQRMNQRAMDIIREEKSKKEVISTGDVLDNVVSALDSVMVDREYMKRCVEEVVVNFSEKGLLNAILKLFGFRAIRKDMNIQFKNDDSHSRLDSMLMLNEGVYKSIISIMASFLADYERKVQQEQESKVDRINELITLLDKREQEVAQFKVDLGTQFQLIVNWIQDVLGMAENDNALDTQLHELMKNLDIEAYWSAEGTTLREAAMFKEMKVEDTSKYKDKPCLICNGEVVAQGIRFCKAETIEHK